MLYFQTVLAFVIMRGWREATATGARLGAVRWRFLFLHAGLLLALASAFWGAPDSDELKLQAFRDVSVSEAYREDGTVRWLDYSLTLEDFDVSYGADGVPSDYTAVVRIGDETVRLRVNHPYSVNLGEDVYLSGYDVDGGDYCVIQIVREPWRYGALAGMIMMITGAFLLFIGGPRRRYSDND
jgi:cytochrome c biogenesis protein ResB